MNRLADPPAALEIPSDRPRPAAQTFRGAVRIVEIPVDLAEALRALSRREGCTLFMTMLASFATLLYRYSGREDFCIGSGVANRRWLETEGLMGMFVKPFALTMRLAANMTGGHIAILAILSFVFLFTELFGRAVAGVGVGLVVSVPLAVGISALEILVVLIQAYVFTLLTAVFIGMAIHVH